MSPAERTRVLLFFVLFFGTAGLLLMLCSCGTEYWLLAAESCSPPTEDQNVAVSEVKVFHEGLFWRCTFRATSLDFSMWDLWISRQSLSKICQAAFLFPFPVHEPAVRPPVEMHSFPKEPYEHHSAIVFRTFWSVFLFVGVTAVVIGSFVVICAGTLASIRLFKVGGALQLCGGLCLAAVLLMYLMWIQVLDTLEQFALHQSLSSCPSYHLSVRHGPSSLLAPAAAFFCALAGLLSIMLARMIQRDGEKNPEF